MLLSSACAILSYTSYATGVLLWYLAVTLSGGALWFIGHWFPILREMVMSEPASLGNADHVIVHHNSGARFVETIKERAVRSKGKRSLFISGSSLEMEEGGEGANSISRSLLPEHNPYSLSLSHTPTHTPTHPPTHTHTHTHSPSLPPNPLALPMSRSI